MSIIRKVKSVERLFLNLEKEIADFQMHSGLCCVSGCGKCCTKLDIEATPLEFLPLAYLWFLEGRVDEAMARLKDCQKDSICIVYAPLVASELTKGSCSQYLYRGLVCRLFGYAANRDKLGQLRLITCKVIKEGQPELFMTTSERITAGMSVPIFTNYYTRLMQIDFRLGSTFLPINQAILMALEIVLHYYAYRPFPKAKKADRLVQ